MRKTGIIVLTLLLALSLLTGCGANRNEGAPSTALPGTTEGLPGAVTGDDERILPDPKDGEVRDSDGIIDDHDSGTETGENETSDRGRVGMAANDANRAGR